MDDIIDKELTVADAAILERIKADYFVNNQAHVDVDVEGQSLNDDKQFVFGCRAGPGIQVSNLIHEMAHLAVLMLHGDSILVSRGAS